MKHARVAYQGAIHDALCIDEDQELLRLADGRTVSGAAVAWLPPLAPVAAPRTIVALGLNYADHASELAFKAPEEPLVFLKSAGTLLGHRGVTPRPADAQYMHYECELAVVIGRTARQVRRDDAFDFIDGYTVANDYAIRDYLENYYRPNLRVKNRDACTPLGPWRVDAADIADPGQLALRTHVNGTQTQQGNTRDLIFDIPFMIEFLSSFMTLSPGDLILTGTPEGLIGVQEGDHVVTEIEGIGKLVNTIGPAASGRLPDAA